MPEPTSNLTTANRPRRWTILASAFLLLALALVVIYTSAAAFFSPIALVVIAAIGLAALLLQIRFRQDSHTVRAPLSLNVLGIVFAAFSLASDLLHLRPNVLMATALCAAVCFGASGAVVLRAFRRLRP